MAKFLSAFKDKIYGLVDGLLWKFGYSNDKQLVEENDRLTASLVEAQESMAEANRILDELIDQRDMLLEYMSNERKGALDQQRLLMAFIASAAIELGGSLSVQRQIFQSVTDPTKSSLAVKFADSEDALVATVTEEPEQPLEEGSEELD